MAWVCSISTGAAVQKDLNQARRWYESAAEHGYDWGMLDMGFLYERGEGVAVDYARAREWYEKAAAARNGLAMSNTASSTRAAGVCRRTTPWRGAGTSALRRPGTLPACTTSV